MVGTYDYWLVLLSLVVAIAASFVALDLAARVSVSSQRRTRAYWLTGGALSMGTGIWCMHFIGMLAFRLPVAVSYDIPVTLGSLLIAITASWFALWVASRETLSRRRLLAAGLLMGFAIISMHYVGMEAMRMEPPIRYRPLLAGVSIAIAVAASLIALWCAFKQRAQTIVSAFWNRAGSAVVMGIAIVGMHYTSMAAARFEPNSVCTASSRVVHPYGLAAALGASTLLFLLATLVVSAYDDYRAAFLQTRVDQASVENARLYSDLQRSEAFLAQGQSISSTGSFGWNVLSGEIYWSEETYRIFEYDRAAVPTLKLILQRAHPDDRPLVQETVDRVSTEGTDFDLEHRLLMPDGRVKDLHVLARALKTSPGNLEFVGAVMDVSERKRSEREQVRLGERLRQAEKMEAMGTLAGGIAHDFNNILGAILGYGELAQNAAAEGSPVRRYLDNVMNAGGRGKALVERILTFSRSSVGKRGPVKVQAVIEETLELLAASLTGGVRLDKRLHAGDAAVVGDATQLHQVTMNLCTNALQAMQNGGVLEVALDRAEAGQDRRLSHGNLVPGDYVRLCVSDTGGGIPPQVLDRMFDPFFTTKGAAGTGLGLSLVHAIVGDLGGAIDVRTTVGRGTTFTIWLPTAGEAALASVEVTAGLPRGDGQTVMIVEDEKPLVELAEEILAELGYEPIGFNSSTVALEAFRAAPQRFDIILTDETMPEIIGTDLAREIALMRPDMPIVLMSGYAGAQVQARARAVGIREILHKPLQRRDIAECFGRVLQSPPPS